jgi:hypothetical protein
MQNAIEEDDDDDNDGDDDEARHVIASACAVRSVAS